MNTEKERICALPGVSRETLPRLEAFATLLERWSAKINLVAPSTLGDVWTRHILDSAQLIGLARKGAKTWCDIGSGAGFPGLIVAICRPELDVTLIEADQRKAAFLRAAIREAGVSAKVVAERSEAVDPCQADIVSARAFAPLHDLLEHVSRHLAQGGQALLLKGQRADEEIIRALESWRFDCEKHPSHSDPTGVVLEIRNIERAK